MSHLNEGAANSSASFSQPTMGRIVANVVDAQSQLVQQFQGLTTALENLKLEQRQLREDLRRSDDRAMKQVDELRQVYSKEVELLTSIISTLIQTDRAAAQLQSSRITPAQTFMNASSPGSFFNQQPSAVGMQQQAQQQQHQMAQLAALMNQQHHLQQHQMMANLINASAHSSNVPPSLAAGLATPVTAVPSTPVQPVKPPAVLPKIEEKKEVVQETVKPKPSAGWECVECSARNEVDQSECAVCGTEGPLTKGLITRTPLPKSRDVKPSGDAPRTPLAPNVAPKLPQQVSVKQELKQEEKKTEGFGDKFKPKPGSWECTTCYVRNDGDVFQCVACGTDQTGKLGDKAAVLAKSAIPLTTTTTTTGTPKFTFGMSASMAAKEATPTPNQKSLFGGGLTDQKAASPVATGAKSSMFGGTTPKADNGSDSSVSVAAPTLSQQQQTPVTFSFASKPPTNTAASPVSFSFKTGATESSPNQQQQKSLFGGSGNSIFGMTAKKPDEDKKGSDNENKSTGEQSASKVFGSGFMPNANSSGSPFGNLFKGAGSKPFYENAEYTEKAKAELNAQKEKEKAKREDDEGEGDEDRGGGAEEEYEPQVDFKPVIPTPDLVNVVTGEEDEEVLFNSRAKLFRWVPELKENKERGLGDIKILHNPKTDSYRVVMRREKVHKICANFRISKDIKLTNKKNMANVLNWACRDYSEESEGTDEIFTIKFKTEETGQEFHNKIEEIRQKMDGN